MRGDDGVIELLNEQLTSELTAINQYFLHSRMQANWGFTELAGKTRKESIEEMQHADRFIQRILFLEGLPNLQDLAKLRIGENAKEMLECDLAAEHESHVLYTEAIEYCEQVKDYTSRALFAAILADEEEHIDFLETQLGLIGRMGEQNYIQTQAGDANQSGGE